MTVGPALPLPPTFCLPAGRKSLTPSVVSQAISPVLALTAIKRDHGGRWHGRTMSRPSAFFPADAETAALLRGQAASNGTSLDSPGQDA